MWLLVFKKSIEKYSIQRLRRVTVQNQYFSVRIVLKLKQFWAWGVIVQNRYFSIRIVSTMNELWARGVTVQKQCFSLRLAFKDNQFKGWEAWMSRINSFLQELHCNWINSNAEAWLFRINAFLKELYWKWINSEAEAWLCRINAFSMRIVSKMNEFWSWSVTVQNECFSFRFYWKSINAEPETSRSRIDSFLQVLHWNVINSESQAWLLFFKKSIEK